MALAQGPLSTGLVLVTVEFGSSLSRYKSLKASVRGPGVQFFSTPFCSPSDLGIEKAR